MHKRINYIDAIRGSVMILLVPYHGMLFLQNRGEQFLGLDPGMFWLHLWRMGLFFAVSGFLAAMTLSLWGPTKQVRQRLIRIGIPLAIGIVTLVPLMKAIVIWYVQVRNPGTVNPKYQWTMANLFDFAPNHLWFLSYLLALNFAALVVWAVIRRWPAIKSAADQGFRWVISKGGLIPILAVISSFILWQGGYVEAPGIVTSSLIPKSIPFFYYAVFFLVGWMLYRSRDLLPLVESRPWTKIGFGAVFAMTAWMAEAGHISLPSALPDAVVVFCAGVATWCTLFGVWGLFARFLPDARPWVKYLADAAYWIYLIHLPILIFIQIGLAGTSLPPVARLIIATGLALSLSFLTYAYLVRHSPIGWLLHGRRKKKPKGKDSDDSPPDTPVATGADEASPPQEVPITPVPPEPEGKPA